ncbi:MAG: DHH family phosphoesterase [Myxococcota bacterium]
MAAVLLASRRVLVTGHADPDGDVAGGCSALFCALRRLGKDVVVFNPDPFPPGYRHLPGAEALVHRLPDDAHFDATVILDAAQRVRVDAFLPRAAADRGKVLWIDHHPLIAPSGDLEWVDEDASSMGEMLFHLIPLLGVRVDREIGMGLYASLLADTGGFRYESTTTAALRLAASLLEAGVHPWEVAEQVYERQPVERVMLLSRVLSTLRLSGSGRFASVVVRERDLTETGATAAMTDGMINHARGIDGVEMAGQLEELGAERWRVTLRSRGGMEAGAVSKLLGERGHRFGACFVRTGPLDTVRAELERAVDDVANTLGLPPASPDR